jgi:hypothetical protein
MSIVDSIRSLCVVGALVHQTCLGLRIDPAAEIGTVSIVGSPYFPLSALV